MQARCRILTSCRLGLPADRYGLPADRYVLLDALTEGYSFGAERGQIRKISDHDHIIAFYDYGVGVYDFDMEKIVPLAEMAQYEAQKKVKEYFEKEKPKQKKELKPYE